MSTNSAARRPAFLAVLVLLAVALPLGAAELLLRARGHEPWTVVAPRNPSESELAEPDPELTWRNKPGRHVLAGYSPAVERIQITIDAAGRRATGAAPDDPRARVALFGDSITMGWAISDDETFAWKLARRFPDVRFENYGVSGFGTYQSLLLMRRILAKERPDLVLYGFYNDHLQRNVQSYQWMNLHDMNRRELTAPYCTTGADGGLVEHAPQPVPHWPLREHLASAYFLEQQWVKRTAARRGEAAWPVGRHLAVAMRDEARRHGARFVFVFLMSRPAVTRTYKEYLRSADIEFIDCERAARPEWRVVNEGHPNGLMNDEWAACLGAALPPLLDG